MIKNIFLCSVISFLLCSNIYSQSTIERKLSLAQSYEQVGQFDNALRLYKEIYAESKENQSAYEGLVRSYNAKSMNTELLVLLETRIKFDKRAINFILLGEARWKAGMSSEADEAWEKVLDEEPNNEFIYADLAEIQTRLQLYEKAIKTYKAGRKNVNRNDNRTPFVDELSKLYIAIGDTKNALSETLLMLKESGNLAATEARIYALMQDDDNIEMIDIQMSEYINSNSSNYLALELYSWYQNTLGNYEKALEYTIKSDDESNADGRLVLTFASNAEREGKTDIALEAYQYLIDKGRSNKFFSSAIYSYTRALESKFLFEKKMSKSKVEEIIERYETIIDEFRQSSTAANAYLEKARLQKEYLQEYDKAEKTLFELIEEIPGASQSGNAYIEIADISLSKGKLKDAVSFLETAKARYGRTNRELLELIDYRLALLQYYSGNLDSAETLFKDLSKVKDNDIANNVLEKNSIIADKYKEEEKTKLFASAEYDLKQLDTLEAVEKYETIVNELRDFDTEIWQRSHLILSDLYTEQGNIEKSNFYLEDFITNLYDGVHTDRAIFKLAQNKEIEGKSDKAIELLSKILIDFPNSIYLNEARNKIRELRGES